MKLPISATLGILSLALTACNGGVEHPSRNAELGYQHYIGAMHEHSGYSDGEIGTTPADYYAAGKALGLDFVAGSEHSDNAHLPLTTNTDCLSPELLECITLPPEGLLKWNYTGDMAAAASDEAFTAIRGFEWTSDRYGHINIYFSQNDLNAKLGLGYLLSMEPFWFWFGNSPDIWGGSDGVMVFNHPGREDALHAACDSLGPLAATCGMIYNGDPSYTWNDFAYRPEVAERVVGIEMYGKSNHYYDGDNGAPPGGWFAHALDKGWNLGPIGAEDEHGREWGQAGRAKTVILAEDRSADSLKEAMLARRFYALAHHYNDLRLDFSVRDPNGQTHVMGSHINHGPGETVELNALISGSGLAQPRIEFVGSGGQVLHAVSDQQASLVVSAVSSEEEWVFVRVIDLGDSDADEVLGEVVAVSAPVWFYAQ